MTHRPTPTVPRIRAALVVPVGLAVLALAVLVLAVAPVAPAAAQAGTTTEWSDHTLVVTAAAPGTLHLTDRPGTPYVGPRYFCAWFSLVIGGTTLDAVAIADPEVGTTYVYHCWFTDPWVDGYPGYPVVTVYDPVAVPPGPLITTAAAARFALDSIEFAAPSIVTSPAGAQVVGVPSWFAVDSALDYAPASAQAGPVWATVQPVFRDVTWDLGDDTRLVCTADATTRWDPSGPDDQTSSCTHTFTRVEPGDQPASIAATVSWTIWQRTDRTAGRWEVWGTVALTTPAVLPVIDLQAVID